MCYYCHKNGERTIFKIVVMVFLYHDLLPYLLLALKCLYKQRKMITNPTIRKNRNKVFKPSFMKFIVDLFIIFPLFLFQFSRMIHMSICKSFDLWFSGLPIFFDFHNSDKWVKSYLFSLFTYLSCLSHFAWLPKGQFCGVSESVTGTRNTQ